MTFEEYRRKRAEAEPRSMTITIIFTLLAILPAIVFVACIGQLLNSGFDLLVTLLAILSAVAAIYCILCAVIGKKRGAVEALFDVLYVFYLR